MKDFAGKIAFITGGASGAGFGQAQIFSEAGMKVVIADVRDDHLQEAKAYFDEKGADVHIIKLDVTDREGWARAADEVERVYGSTVDLLVLTAGVNVFGPAEATTFDDFDWVTSVCYFGVANGLITFVPRMIKAGKKGHIAATVSWGAFGAGPTTAPYAAESRRPQPARELFRRPQALRHRRDGSLPGKHPLENLRNRSEEPPRKVQEHRLQRQRGDAEIPRHHPPKGHGPARPRRMAEEGH